MTKKSKKVETPSSYRVILTRMASNNANLRTPTVQGVTASLPEVGKSFVMTGESLTPGASFRLIETSEVVTVDDGDEWEDPISFTTKNSSYKLELLPEEEEG